MVTVPAGTIVQTERINGTLYQLSVTVDTAIPAGTVSALIPVQATGAARNLAPGYYRILPVAVTGIASVANEDDWLTTPVGMMSPMMNCGNAAATSSIWWAITIPMRFIVR